MVGHEWRQPYGEFTPSLLVRRLGETGRFLQGLNFWDHGRGSPVVEPRVSGIEPMNDLCGSGTGLAQRDAWTFGEQLLIGPREMTAAAEAEILSHL